MTAPFQRLLRAESAAVALGLAVLLAVQGPAWWLVVAVLAAPDLALLAYLAGPRAGALVYNAAHSYAGPALLAAAAGLAGWEAGLAAAGTWALHAAIDRALGFGLKSREGFAVTHLGRIGRS
ncbi:DUF4260 family protein [Oceanicella sp. SM1341]|uniref:DUF4260 family protein n=1 Tax=Oceanicella sp. SM1341 TaxID=1548889 RepID=UPI000E4DA07D|nr:DUF4260 family protein [Oceanicella sp. SM1341]